MYLLMCVMLLRRVQMTIEDCMRARPTRHDRHEHTTYSVYSEIATGALRHTPTAARRWCVNYEWEFPDVARRRRARAQHTTQHIEWNGCVSEQRQLAHHRTASSHCSARALIKTRLRVSRCSAGLDGRIMRVRALSARRSGILSGCARTRTRSHTDIIGVGLAFGCRHFSGGVWSCALYGRRLSASTTSKWEFNSFCVRQRSALHDGLTHASAHRSTGR